MYVRRRVCETARGWSEKIFLAAIELHHKKMVGSNYDLHVIYLRWTREFCFINLLKRGVHPNNRPIQNKFFPWKKT
jgi:hypothetical protein